MSDDQIVNQDQFEAEQLPAHAMFRDLGEGDDAASIGRAKKTTRITTQIMIVLVVLVGGAAIYWMRQTGMKSGMDFSSQPVAFTSQYTPEDHARFQRVLRDLEYNDRRVQIPASMSGSNPFFMGIVKEDLGAKDAEDRAERERLRREEEQRRARENRKKLIIDGLARLRLGTILYSSDPRATIDNQIAAVGDTVAEHFTVVEIQPQSVVLEADGVQYTITPQSHGPGSRR